MGRGTRFSPEVRSRAVRLVMESLDAYESEWGAIVSVAEKIGCSPETLRKWLRRSQVDSGDRAGVTSETAERVKDLEREVRELRRANEILRKASAFFAAAELDRQRK